LIIGQEGGVIGEHGSNLVGAGDVEGASKRRVEQSQLGLVVQPVILQLIEEELVHLGNAFGSSSSQFEVISVGTQGKLLRWFVRRRARKAGEVVGGSGDVFHVQRRHVEEPPHSRSTGLVLWDEKDHQGDWSGCLSVDLRQVELQAVLLRI